MTLVEKISAKPSQALMAKLPKGRGANVEVTLTEGQTLRETVEIPEGDAERPLSRKSLERKFMNFATPVIGASTAKRILALVDGLEELGEVRQLTQGLKGDGKQNPI